MEDEKYKMLFGEMALRLNAQSPKEMCLLIRAIEYANINDYYEIPKSKDEQTWNDIFFIKCKCYFERKLIEFRKDYPDLQKRINQIFDYEHRTVMSLKMKITPTCQK